MSFLLSDPLEKKQEFFGINGLRFIAAFWVLIFHASIHFGALSYLSLVQPIIDQGVLAMSLFFTLSGFVLSYRYRYFRNREEATSFYAARVARLYPVYIFMGLITIWLLPDKISEYVLPNKYGWPGEISFYFMIIGLFLFAIQAWFPNLFGVWNFGGSWSLSVEAFFYSLFPKLRRNISSQTDEILHLLVFGIPGIMLIILLGMITSLTTASAGSQIFYVLPIFRLPEFIFGIAGYVLFVERGKYHKQLYLFSTLSLTFLLIAVSIRNLPGLIDYGWLAIMPFMGAFVLSLRLNAPPKIKSTINYLGRISYCVYMAQFVTIPILKANKENISTELLWLILLSSTLLLAVVTYHLVETQAYQKTFGLAKSIFSRTSAVKNSAHA